MMHTLHYTELVKYYNDKHTIKECAQEFNMTEYGVTCTLSYYAAHYGYVRRYTDQMVKCGCHLTYLENKKA